MTTASTTLAGCRESSSTKYGTASSAVPMTAARYARRRPIRSDGHADLRPAPQQAGPAPGPPLHREQDGPSPLAADPDALDHAEDGQQHAPADADGAVVGDQPDRGRGQAHGEEGGDQRRLAA